MNVAQDDVYLSNQPVQIDDTSYHADKSDQEEDVDDDASSLNRLTTTSDSKPSQRYHNYIVIDSDSSQEVTEQSEETRSPIITPPKLPSNPGISSEARLKRVLNRNKKSNSTNHQQNDAPIYLGMRVLALYDRKIHLWKPATVVKIENHIQIEDEHQDMTNIQEFYKIICSNQYTVRFEESMDDQECGWGYKNIDDLMHYFKNDEEENEHATNGILCLSCLLVFICL
jgi:hypothetical protein